MEALHAVRPAFAKKHPHEKEGTADGVVAFGISNPAMSLITRMISSTPSQGVTAK
jgi:hypothetical protein